MKQKLWGGGKKYSQSRRGINSTEQSPRNKGAISILFICLHSKTASLHVKDNYIQADGRRVKGSASRLLPRSN